MSFTKNLNNWKKKVLEPIKAKKPLRKDKFSNNSGIEIADLYGPINEDSYDEKIGFPGQFPFTRGVHASMYRGKLWTMRQYAGFSTAHETNKRYKLLLENGATALSVAFDLPTQMGRDSDHPKAKGEIGRVGVAIDTVEDMKILFSGIPLDKVSTSMTINSTAAILLAMYIVVAEEQGVDKREIKGTVQNDILKEYIARGTYIYPPEPSLKLIVDLIEYAQANTPKWNTLSVSGYHIREAGSTAAQELAFTIANGLSYLDAALSRGLKIDDVAPRVAFFFNCHNNFFEEVAKFRAARRMWARIVKEKYKPKNEASLKLRFHTQTAGSSLTARQPLVNISRTTTQALASVLGGTQSLHTNGYDEALGLPSEDAARIALRCQQYIAYETGVADTVDPLAGSYFVEQLTDELENTAKDYLTEIEKKGGMLKAIRDGYPQNEIEESAYKYQKSIETGERQIVGVNCFEIEQTLNIEAHKLSPDSKKTQLESLAKLKASRDSKKVEESIKRLATSAKLDENLMPKIIEAVKARATIGEISDTLRSEYGEYQT